MRINNDTHIAAATMYNKGILIHIQIKYIHKIERNTHKHDGRSWEECLQSLDLDSFQPSLHIFN